MSKKTKTKKLKKNLFSQKGALENVVVALFLVIIGVGALVGLSSWVVSEKDDLEVKSSSKLTSVLTEITESP